MNVDLPAPFGPVRPYLRPAENVVVTSSKSTFDPNRIDTPWTEIIAIALFIETIFAAGGTSHFTANGGRSCRDSRRNGTAGRWACPAARAGWRIGDHRLARSRSRPRNRAGVGGSSTDRSRRLLRRCRSGADDGARRAV